MEFKCGFFSFLFPFSWGEWYEYLCAADEWFWRSIFNVACEFRRYFKGICAGVVVRCVSYGAYVGLVRVRVCSVIVDFGWVFFDWDKGLRAEGFTWVFLATDVFWYVVAGWDAFDVMVTDVGV